MELGSIGTCLNNSNLGSTENSGSGLRFFFWFGRTATDRKCCLLTAEAGVYKLLKIFRERLILSQIKQGESVKSLIYSGCVCMGKSKKELTLLHNEPETKLCLNCGFPNRGSDKHCMYCQASLVEDDGLFSWMRQTYYVLRWRWQLKQRYEDLQCPPPSRVSFLKLMGYFSVGTILSGAGIYFFTSAVSDGSFSSGLIAILFLSYGVFILKTLFTKK